MHIPDGFLSPQVWAPAYLASAGAVVYSVRKSREVLNESMVPRLGVMAAFIFAAQMVNFPVAGAASGHLLGAALAAVTLGPWNASLVITAVLLIQMLVFQDGGISVLGANVLNMALAGVFTAHIAYNLVFKIVPGKKGRNAAIFIASWLSVIAAALMASVELGLSYGIHQVPVRFIILAMVGWHSLIGIGEGLLTVAAVNFIEKTGFGDHLPQRRDHT